ncbi:MAG: class I lanthipeptide [Acidobacteriota bacterium]
MKKRNATKTLKLHRETLSTLDPEKMQLAEGGVTFQCTTETVTLDLRCYATSIAPHCELTCVEC